MRGRDITEREEGESASKLVYRYESRFMYYISRCSTSRISAICPAFCFKNTYCSCKRWMELLLVPDLAHDSLVPHSTRV
jgi:hypothetical protein